MFSSLIKRYRDVPPFSENCKSLGNVEKQKCGCDPVRAASSAGAAASAPFHVARSRRALTRQRLRPDARSLECGSSRRRPVQHRTQPLRPYPKAAATRCAKGLECGSSRQRPVQHRTQPLRPYPKERFRRHESGARSTATSSGRLFCCSRCESPRMNFFSNLFRSDRRDRLHATRAPSYLAPSALAARL